MRIRQSIFAVALAGTTAMGFTACNDDDDDSHIEVIGFEKIVLGENGYMNDASYEEEDLVFENKFDATYYSWSGFAISNLTDTVTAGWGNQYSVYGNGGANGSKQFAIVYKNSDENYQEIGALITSDDRESFCPVSAYFALTTYTYLSMRDGDSYAKKFADGDWYCVTLRGYDKAGNKVSEKEIYAADYRDGKRIMFDKWTKVSLEDMGKVSSLRLFFSGSDSGAWGLNTPAYIAIDDLAIKD